MMNSKLRQLAVATVLSVTVWPLSAHHVRAQDQPGTPVEAVKVKTEAIVMETTAVGTLLSNETVIVRPEIEGRLTDAQAHLSLAATNFERSQELFKKKAGTERGLDEARAAYRVAEAAVELAKARMTKTTIEAPFEGVVGLRHVSTGDYVTAGKDLVNLEDIDPLKVEFAVPERYLSAVKEGQVVRLTADAFPDETFEGAIYAINPQIDTSGRSIQVRARISNDDRKLRPGLFVRVKVQLGQREQAIMIPEEALVPRGKDGQPDFATETPGQIGLRRVGEVEITSGLAADDMVITAGQLKIRNGVPVKPVGDEPKPADAPKGS